MIDPVYYQTWFTVVDQAKNKYGWNMPLYVEQYLSVVLANYTDKPDWQPDPSWAETLLSIQSAAAAKVLGDQALFAAAVFPTFLEYKGLTEKYFYDIGSISYKRASTINYALFETLSENFEFLSQCLRRAVHDNNQLQYINKSSSS
jgi:hypothetical protein